jgi:hypothetical protein
MSKVVSQLLGNGEVVTKYYNSLKQLHREDGPAVSKIFVEEWWESGKLHRREGPAIFINNPNYIRAEWWNNGVLHRENNKPAIIDSEGSIEYWEHGERIK